MKKCTTAHVIIESHRKTTARRPSDGSGKEVRDRRLLLPVGGTGSWCSCYRKQHRHSSKTKKRNTVSHNVLKELDSIFRREIQQVSFTEARGGKQPEGVDGWKGEEMSNHIYLPIKRTFCHFEQGR